MNAKIITDSRLMNNVYRPIKCKCCSVLATGMWCQFWPQNGPWGWGWEKGLRRVEFVCVDVWQLSPYNLWRAHYVLGAKLPMLESTERCFFPTINRTYLKFLNPQSLIAWELLPGHVKPSTFLPVKPSTLIGQQTPLPKLNCFRWSTSGGWPSKGDAAVTLCTHRVHFILLAPDPDVLLHQEILAAFWGC